MRIVQNDVLQAFTSGRIERVFGLFVRLFLNETFDPRAFYPRSFCPVHLRARAASSPVGRKTEMR